MVLKQSCSLLSENKLPEKNVYLFSSARSSMFCLSKPGIGTVVINLEKKIQITDNAGRGVMDPELYL